MHEGEGTLQRRLSHFFILLYGACTILGEKDKKSGVFHMVLVSHRIEKKALDLGYPAMSVLQLTRGDKWIILKFESQGTFMDLAIVYRLHTCHAPLLLLLLLLLILTIYLPKQSFPVVFWNV